MTSVATSLIVQRSRRGLPFLGYVIFPHHRRLTRASKRRLIKRATARHRELMEGKIGAAEAARRMNSLIAFTARADTHTLRTELFRKLNKTYGCYE